MSDESRVMLAGSESESLAQYRSMSSLAVTALVLGLLSVLAWLHPMSWVVPLAGIGTALWALRNTGESDGKLGGRRLAIAGLCFSLFFGTSAISYWWMEQRWVAWHAREFAEEFLGFLANGEYPRAMECQETGLYRQPASVPLNEFYTKDEGAKKSLDSFLRREAVQALVNASGSPAFEWKAWKGYRESRYQKTCAFEYYVFPEKSPPQLAGNRDDLPTVIVEVSRQIDPEITKQTTWWVSDFRMADD